MPLSHRRTMYLTCITVAGALLTCVRTTASADPLDLYAGAGIGNATVSLDSAAYTLPLHLNRHDVGWKAMVGLRPLSLIGAEVEYVDFGHPADSQNSGLVALNTNVHAHAQSAFGLFYLPLPIPFVDLYGKAGLSRLQTSASVTPVTNPSVCSIAPTTSGCAFGLSRTDTHMAWGIGSQVKLASWSIRVEYERFSSPSGNPGFASASLAWHF